MQCTSPAHVVFSLRRVMIDMNSNVPNSRRVVWAVVSCTAMFRARKFSDVAFHAGRPTMTSTRRTRTHKYTPYPCPPSCGARCTPWDMTWTRRLSIWKECCSCNRVDLRGFGRSGPEMVWMSECLLAKLAGNISIIALRCRRETVPEWIFNISTVQNLEVWQFKICLQLKFDSKVMLIIKRQQHPSHMLIENCWMYPKKEKDLIRWCWQCKIAHKLVYN